MAAATEAAQYNWRNLFLWSRYKRICEVHCGVSEKTGSTLGARRSWAYLFATWQSPYWLVCQKVFGDLFQRYHSFVNPNHPRPDYQSISALLLCICKAECLATSSRKISHCVLLWSIARCQLPGFAAQWLVPLLEGCKTTHIWKLERWMILGLKWPNLNNNNQQPTGNWQ